MPETTELQSFTTLEAMMESAVEDFAGEIEFVDGKDFSKASDRTAAEVRRVRVSLRGGKPIYFHLRDFRTNFIVSGRGNESTEVA